MSIRRWLPLLLVVALQASAQAQPAAAASSAAAADKAEAAAAMERAQRMATNPLRVIIEAGKVRRKAAESEPAPAVAVPRAAPTTRAATAGAAAPAATATPATAPPMASAPPVAAAASSPASAAASVSASPASVLPTPVSAMPATVEAPVQPAAALPSDPPPSAAAASGPPPAEPQRPAAAASAADAAPPAGSPPLPQPKLLEMVEPQLPQTALDALRGADVIVELTIRADGSVAAVNVLPPAPRQVQRPIAAALEKWRFEPLPGQQVHRVSLAFGTAP